MIGPPGNVRVYLACGVTDMRRGIDGLSTLAECVCQRRLKTPQKLECAPGGGHFELQELTIPVGLLENGSHDEASIAQRGVQAPSR
jgi:hypothetical protein